MAGPLTSLECEKCKQRIAMDLEQAVRIMGTKKDFICDKCQKEKEDAFRKKYKAGGFYG